MKLGQMPCERCGLPRSRRGTCHSCGNTRRPSVPPPDARSRPTSAPVYEPPAGSERQPHARQPRARQPRARQPHARQRSLPIPNLYRSSSPPSLVGKVVEAAPTAARAGDRPWWVYAAMVLAIGPGVVAAIVLIFLRVIHWMVMAFQKAMLARMTFGLLGRRSASGGILGRLISSIDLKIKLDLRLEGWRRRVHTVVRVWTPNGEKVCRVALAPEVLTLAVGDEISVWGPRRSDGIWRAFELHNRTTSTGQRPAALPPSIAAFATMSFVLVVMAVASIQGSGG
jgi:hypothetical protein